MRWGAGLQSDSPQTFLDSVPFYRKMRYLIVVFFILIVGCFNLRTPEEPEEGNFWEYPDAPEKVLDNLRLAYIYRSIDNIKNSLDSSSFEFIADPSLLLGPNRDLYINWDYEREIERTTEFFQSLDLTIPLPVTIAFTEDSVDSQPHLVRFKISYTLSARLSNGSILNAKGTSIFTTEEDPSGLWYLTRWEDFKEDDYLSWGELKAGDY